MTPRPPEACSQILSAIEEIESYTGDLGEALILQDKMRMPAIERCLQVITEAVRFLPNADCARYPHIEWSAIEGMGNVLRHEYFQVNSDVVLRVVRFELQPLKVAVSEMSTIALRDAEDPDTDQ